MENSRLFSNKGTLRLTTFRLPGWQLDILRRLPKGQANAFVRRAIAAAIEKAALNDSSLFERKNVVTGMRAESPTQEVAAFSSIEGGVLVFSNDRESGKERRG
jgi:hypothetical protein